MADHDPFKHYSPYHEIHQRINQVNSAIGAPAVLDWTEIDAMSEAMADNLFGRIGPLDSHPDAQNLARDLIDSYRTAVRLPQIAGETIIAEHLGPQYGPRTMTRLYALMAIDHRGLVPLSEEFTWQDVAKKYMTNHRVCDVELWFGCDKYAATIDLPVKLGEFVCLFKCCAKCREWFDEPKELRDDYRKPTGWSDEFDRR